MHIKSRAYDTVIFQNSEMIRNVKEVKINSADTVAPSRETDYKGAVLKAPYRVVELLFSSPWTWPWGGEICSMCMTAFPLVPFSGCWSVESTRAMVVWQ